MYSEGMRAKPSAEGAIGYARVLGAAQAARGLSLDAQAERIRGYARALDLNLVQIVREEGISAKIALAQRPGGQRLLRLSQPQQVAHIVVCRLDRLFGSAAEALPQLQAWDEAGVALHFIDWGGRQALNTRSAVGKLLFPLAAGFAECERNLIGERVAEALKRKKAARRVYGAIPFGYDRRGQELLKNPREQKVLRDISRARHERGLSLAVIAKVLNRKKVPTKKGGKWYPSTVRNLLHNEIQAAQTKP